MLPGKPTKTLETVRDNYVMCRIPGFLESDERPAMQRLCDAFLERDGDAVVEACGDIVFRSMATDVSFSLSHPLLSLFLFFSGAHNVILKNSACDTTMGKSIKIPRLPMFSVVAAENSTSVTNYAILLLQVAKLALDLKKKFEYSSPTHTSSSTASAKPSASSSTGRSSSSSKSAGGGGGAVSAGSGRFSDMKSELFGGGSSSDKRKVEEEGEPVVETTKTEEVERERDTVGEQEEEEEEEEDEGGFDIN